MAILARNKRFGLASITLRSTRANVNGKNKRFLFLGQPHSHSIILVQKNSGFQTRKNKALYSESLSFE
jgi:hypothetical protein